MVKIDTQMVQTIRNKYVKQMKIHSTSFTIEKCKLRLQSNTNQKIW